MRLGEEAASRCAEHALAHARAHHERGHQARALWLLSEIAMHCTPSESEPAGAAYRQAEAMLAQVGGEDVAGRDPGSYSAGVPENG
jgi:hypothetical protein